MPFPEPNDTPSDSIIPENEIESPGNTLDLSPEQLASLGLADCEPGESYTITLKKGADGQSFDIVSSEPSVGPSDPLNPDPLDDAPEPIEDDEIGEGAVPAPPVEPELPLDDARAPAKSEEDILGFKRNRPAKRPAPMNINKLRE